MAVPKHLDEAVARLNQASARIDEARAQPLTLAGLKEWLEALTDYGVAMADVHTFNNESVHEKLHQLAGHVGLRAFPPASPRGGRGRPAAKGRRRT